MTVPGPLESQVPAIAVADLRAMMDANPKGVALLDTRDRASFERGHVPGSIHCPVHELSKRERDLPSRGATVVVVGEPGKRGAAGAVFLVLAGYGSVLLLAGGFPAWDGPVETGPTAAPPPPAGPPGPAGAAGSPPSR